MTLYSPEEEGKFPVIVDGHESFRGITDSLTEDVVGRSYALAVFDRTGIVADRVDPGKWLYSSARSVAASIPMLRPSAQAWENASSPRA